MTETKKERKNIKLVGLVFFPNGRPVVSVETLV
jgi:hypothetical protein